MDREAGVNRGEGGTRLDVSADTVDRRRMTDTSTICGQHARAAMAAQNARSVRGLAVARVVASIAVPLDGGRAEMVVGRLYDGQPENRRKLQQEHSGGGLPDPACVVRPQHAGKGSAGDRRTTRLRDELVQDMTRRQLCEGADACRAANWSIRDRIGTQRDCFGYLRFGRGGIGGSLKRGASGATSSVDVVGGAATMKD